MLCIHIVRFHVFQTDFEKNPTFAIEIPVVFDDAAMAAREKEVDYINIIGAVDQVAPYGYETTGELMLREEYCDPNPPDRWHIRVQRIATPRTQTTTHRPEHARVRCKIVGEVRVEMLQWD